MSPFDTILLPLDGSEGSARAVGCAVWLAERLGATLHVLHSTRQPLPASEALGRLGAGAARHTPTIVHQSQREPAQAAVDATREHGIKLVVMTARGGSAAVGVDPGRVLGRVASALIEDSTVPVVLLPLRYREILPWRSMVAAASGEDSADQALAAAIRLSSTLRLSVNVLHVHDAERLAIYIDALHHEYPRRLEQMLVRATVRQSAEECRCIETIAMRRGDPARELLAEIEARHGSLLAVGWHGELQPMRALVLKELLELASCPLLIVRAEKRTRVRLKIGDALGAR
jgi:nucleotide-binding universal stress UspA family protein